MKKIIVLLFFAIIALTAVKANALTNEQILSKIVSKPIGYRELKTINYLINNRVNFTVKDLRGLLRNFIGFNKTVSVTDSGLGNLLSVKKESKKIRKHCATLQYSLVNGKIINTNIIRYCPVRATTRERNFWGFYTAYSYMFVNKPRHEKKLALLVEKILKTYPSVYKNINRQGRHYQTVTYIAAARGMSHVLYFLLNDKNINPGISTISQGSYLIQQSFDGNRAASFYPYTDNYILDNTGSCYNPNNANIDKYYVLNSNQVFPIQVFLRNIRTPSVFDKEIQKKLLGMTKYLLYNIWYRIGASISKNRVAFYFHRPSGHVYSKKIIHELCHNYSNPFQKYKP
jgi:hypothetical protein